MTGKKVVTMTDSESSSKGAVCKKRSRHVSDDVASLDSWSEVCQSPEIHNENKTVSSVDTGNPDHVPTSSSKHSDHRSRGYSENSDPWILNPKTLVSLQRNSHGSIQEEVNPLSYSDEQRPSTDSGIVNFNLLVSQSQSASSRLYPSLNIQDDHPPEENSKRHYSPVLAQKASASRENSYFNHVKGMMRLPNMPNGLTRITQINSANRSAHPQIYPHTSSENGFEQSMEQGEKVKNKLLSVWNNVKYGWTIKTKTNFRFDSPLFLLGKCYHLRLEDDDPCPGEQTSKLPSMELFRQDFVTRLWFTYRRDFPKLSGTKYTTDCGWGCMLRSGQMMFSQALVLHFLHRDWRVFHAQTREQIAYHRQIIRWFGDYPSDQSPFSVHRLVEVGCGLGKNPGDWYGPNSVAHVFKEAFLRAYTNQPVLSDVCVYVAQDCTVYKQEILDMCTQRFRSSSEVSPPKAGSESEKNDTTNGEGTDGGFERAVVILVPVRLGGEALNPVYIPCVKSLLAQDSCIGIIGGKPKHSLYFVGWQDDKLIYLDPHYCQDVVDTRERNFSISTFHCMSPRKIHFSRMDPSCTVGFYCRTREEFDKFVQQAEQMVSPPNQRGSFPMFVFSEGRCSDMNLDDLSLDEEKYLRIRHVKLDDLGRVRSATYDSEEFVVL